MVGNERAAVGSVVEGMAVRGRGMGGKGLEDVQVLNTVHGQTQSRPSTQNTGSLFSFGESRCDEQPEVHPQSGQTRHVRYSEYTGLAKTTCTCSESDGGEELTAGNITIWGTRKSP
jgi:hypothetical protein